MCCNHNCRQSRDCPLRARQPSNLPPLGMHIVQMLRQALDRLRPTQPAKKGRA